MPNSSPPIDITDISSASLDQSLIHNITPVTLSRDDQLNSCAECASNHSNRYDDNVADPLAYYHDTCLAHQSPVRPLKNNLSITETPLIHSPDLSSIKALKFTDTNELSSTLNAVNGINKKLNKKRKVTYSPQDSILSFLRGPFLSIISRDSDKFDSNHHFKRGYMKFVLKLDNGGITWAPFRHLYKILKNATCPLTVFHQRLLIEDFMMLEPGATIFCLISPTHYFLNPSAQYGSIQIQSQWINLMSKALTFAPYQPLQINGKTFFTITLTVHSNPNLQNFKDKILTQSEICYLCGKSGGGGLNCNIAVSKVDCSNTINCKLFKFHHFMDNPDNIQFWGIQLSSRIPKIKDSLSKLKGGLPSIIPRLKRYMDEYEGDSTSTLVLAQFYEVKVKEQEFKLKLEAYRESKISSSRIALNFTLSDDDPSFVKFRSHVDEITKTAILSVYGKFAEFTSPILSEAELNDIATSFKMTLPTYYDVINVMLNKAVSIVMSITCRHVHYSFFMFPIKLLLLFRNHLHQKSIVMAGTGMSCTCFVLL